MGADTSGWLVPHFPVLCHKGEDLQEKRPQASQ